LTVAERGANTGSAHGWSADQALTDLYAGHWRSLVRLSWLLVRDQQVAEETVQDAFVSLSRHWSGLRDREQALAYLRRSVVNGSRSVLRHRSVHDRFVARETGRTLPDEASAEDRVLAREDAGSLMAALGVLPRRQREVLVLRYYLDLSEAQIAHALGISPGSVKAHAHRGLAALRADVEALP
jgi:RNA polymerase sigma-70 factor (sigma-E family)